MRCASSNANSPSHLTHMIELRRYGRDRIAAAGLAGSLVRPREILALGNWVPQHYPGPGPESPGVRPVYPLTVAGQGP